MLMLASACASKSGQGAGVGAVGGGLVGAAVGGETGALVGAALGGLGGYAIGREMDRRDRERALMAIEQNRAMEWQNPNTGAYYQVQPTETIVRGGRQCREFRMVADVEGRPDEIYGTACRAPDGSWEVVDT